MEEKEKDNNLLTVWKTEDGIGSEWHSECLDDVVGIIMAICKFAKTNRTFMILLLGSLADCLNGGRFSDEIDKSSVDISNFNDILKNTDNNG